MKRLSLMLILSFVAGFSALQAQNEPKAVLTGAEEVAIVEWVEDTSYDFGKIEKGVPVQTAFELKNLKEETLLIDNVRTTCGCTAPDWTKEPIMPGTSSKINISYNAAKEGKFNKVIKVYLKGQKEPELLIIQGEVLGKEG